MQQCTIKKPIHISGKALHSGLDTALQILPAPANTGIKFIRTDASVLKAIPALSFEITSTTLSTTIGSGSHSVSTIEHLMAALALMGIDNATIEVNGPEVPILDGSSQPFIHAIRSTGIETHRAAKHGLFIAAPLELRDGDKYIRAEPHSHFEASCSIAFAAPIGFQRASYSDRQQSITQIANARTFCQLEDVERMRRQGLAKGGSLDNALVVTDSKVLNKEGLRSKNEFAQHKLLDLVGDLSLLGHKLMAKVSAHKPGHNLQAAFMEKLLSSQEFSIRPITKAQSSNAKWHARSEYAYG